ncbi:MAG: type I polyketide synthase [Gemmatimonadaceae bacterium]|nr:type I polyketide synthase [Gemmatimonadaceae bacterium]
MTTRDALGDAAMPIALIGIGCRFPGGIVDPASFWQLLENGVDAISDIPADRFDIERFYDPKPGTRGRVTTRFGGFVKQPLEDFDAAFFGISRSYAERLDPQQRLLLETAWEAMEDAGLDIVGMQGSPTGIFVGQWVSDYEHRLFADTGGIDFQMAMGSGRYAAAGRLSYAFGFRGASLSIDAACSSGLASVHLAMRSLRNGDSAVALAGGVNMILEPHIHLAYSYSKMLAPDGRCRFGDNSGAGYVRSEGAGMVVLKPLADALADGDHIYAVLRGSAVNNDGNSSGAMGRPSMIGQAELIRSALRDGGVRASQLQYVEAHGTGTRAGDPVELGALGTVLSDDRAPDAPKTWVGSVKTNFGHTEAAAGVAGLIKTVLMLERRQIAPSLHFATPNVEVPWSTLPIAIPTTLRPWPTQDGPRFAGVSSYGIGGTNAHVVLESAPEPQPAPVIERADGAPLLLPLSARSRPALRAMAARYSERLSDEKCDASAVCFSAATRRSALPYRAAFVASDHAALQTLVQQYASGAAATADGVVHDLTRRRVAFVVPGQGAQWVGMARRFFTANVVFHDALVACDTAARRVVPWSIVEQLFLDADADGYIGDRIDVIQPTLVAVAIAYAGWLRSIGIEPDAVVGHSLGEVGAAAIAGALDIETAMRVICLRSALMSRTSGQGAMAVIDMAQADLEQRLTASASVVTVSVSNSPRSTVVSGAPADVHDLLAQLDRDGVYARLVKVDVASHGPQMDPLVPELVDALRDIRPVDSAVAIYSSVAAARTPGSAFDAHYWGRNLREPVQFAHTIDAMIADGISAFIELGPHAVLSYAIAQTADAVGRDVITVACGARDIDDQLTATGVIAALWASGAAIEWTRVTSGGTVVPLPLYPWQRERFWHDTSAVAARAVATPKATSYPFLGARIDSAAEGGGTEWDVRFSTDEAPWLADHVVRGSAIVPAAALIDVMATAVRESLGDAGDVELRHVQVSEAIPLRSDPVVLRLVVTRPSTETVSLQLRLKDDAGWHAVASARGALVDEIRSSHGADDASASDRTDGSLHYTRMRRREHSYGPAFQVVSSMATIADSTTARMTAAQAGQLARRVTLLDGALQSLLALAPPVFASPHETIVPVGADRIVLRTGTWPGTATATVRVTATCESGLLGGDLQIHDDTGAEHLTVSGVQMRVVRSTASESLSTLRYRVAWTPVPLANTRIPRAQWLVVHDAGGAGAHIASRLRDAGHDVRDWLVQELREAHALPPGTQHVVICTPLDAAGDVRASALDAALINVYDAPLALIQLAAAADSVPTRVITVTDGAVAVTTDRDVVAPLQHAAWGLSRVARHEHPSIGCVVVDAAWDTLADALLTGLTTADDAELAWRDGQWWASRIEPVSVATLPSGASATSSACYTADIATPGMVDSVAWRESALPALAPHEVLIEVAASGLNFLDLLVVLNAYPATEAGSISAAPALGLECAGFVTRVGSAVRSVSAGDRVMAVCEGSLASHVVAKDALVVRIPDGVSLEDASSFPIAFLTAARSLEEVARVGAGERVLIHSAGGGVGLAALQIARNRGAEIFATAGTADKRAMLRQMGVQHVFDSRELTWGDAVLAATNGAGVDVVLNSLSGAAIEIGFRVLAPYGRFVEIGKRDVFGDTRIGLSVFRKQVTVTSVYLLEQMRMDAAPLGALLRDLVARLAHGVLTPLPVTQFTADQVSDACRAMVPGTHVGKLVVTHHTPPSVVRRVAHGATVHEDATYLITGGLGALGQRAAAWLVSRGARHLLLIGRSSPSAEVQRVIEAWRADGITVSTLAIDIATDDGISQVRTALAMSPTLRGVIHAAGVLDDGLIAAQDAARMRTVASAKVGGLLQLATLPGFDATDFVVVYSSVASVLGTRGQSNYAAANAVLDAFVHTLRARGVRATSVSFGPFAGVGLATEGRRLDILADSGLGALRPVFADAALDALAGSTSVHEIVAVFDRSAWIGVFDTPTERRLLNFDAEPVAPVNAPRNENGFRGRLAAAVGERQRADIVLQFVQQEVATVLRSTPERIEPRKPLRAMGIDSLTALDLRNRLEQATGLRLAGTLVFNYPNAAAIASHMLERLTEAVSPSSVPAAPAAAVASGDDALDALAREMAGLDEHELRQLLAEHGTGEGA